MKLGVNTKISKIIYTSELQSGGTQLGVELTRRKMKNWGRKEGEEWLAIYKEKKAKILLKFMK